MQHAGPRTAQALVNAGVVADAELYYRNMLERDELSWNLRDAHMVETVAAIESHLKVTFRSEGRCIICVCRDFGGFGPFKPEASNRVFGFGTQSEGR